MPSSASPRVPASAPRAQPAERTPATDPRRADVDADVGICCGGGNLGFCFSTRGEGYETTPWHLLALRRDRHARGQLRPDGRARRRPTVPGWRKPTDSLTWAASDNAGIRRRALLVDGAEVAASATDCDATRPVPCANFPASPVALGPVTDGRHEVKLVATDSAGNPTTVAQTVTVDGNGPAATVTRASGKTITVAVSDGASGVAGGTIPVRNSPSEPFRALPTSFAERRADRQTRSRQRGEGRDLRSARATTRAM